MAELKQVKASAGSGKTYQLTQRFLSLLNNAEESTSQFTCTGRPLRGYAWPEIMAVTFTNKAASEMKERVVTGLKLSALDINPQDAIASCSAPVATRTIESVLRRYHRLNIRTIDSLLTLLLRLFSLEFGIRPDFQTVFEEKELFEIIYDHFMLVCENNATEHNLLDAAITTMLKSEQRKGFWLQDGVRSRLLELAKFLRNQNDPFLTDQDEIKDILTAAYGEFTENTKEFRQLLNNTDLPINARFTTFIEKCLAIELFSTPPESAFTQKASFRECVNKAGKDAVNEEHERHYATFKKAYTAYRTHHTVLTGAYYLAPVAQISLQLLNGLKELEKQRGIILGSSLAKYVNELLQQNEAVSEAYCRLGCRLHHMLIDEFQDTSLGQWQAVTPLSQECLAKGGSLFYVGDVKQAIYGWRGGDSALFDKVITQPDIASLAHNIETENLPDNWRSFKHVVEFNNTFFSHFENIVDATNITDSLFNKAPDDFRQDFASELMKNFDQCSQSIPDKHVETGGYVRMEMLPGGKTEDIEEQTIDSLGELMENLCKRRRYRDIAILVRSHSEGSLVCDLLVQQGIPVITENSLQLDKHPIIRQLAAFLAFLDYPRDDMAFLSFITGNELFLAESGITKTTIHDWIVAHKKGPLGMAFRATFPDQWKQFIEPFYNQSGLMTPYDLTQEAIRTYRVLERHPDAELYIRRFLEVVHLAEENGYGSLSAFLEYWSEKSGNEKVPLPENIDAVHIMTIHKSKGLEFPVVIVPFHNWKVKKDTDYTIRTYQGKKLLTPMKKELGKPYLTSLGRSVREQLNLLYVAWTRAREELYGFFVEKASQSPALTAMNLFLDMQDEPVFEYGEPPTGETPSEVPAQPQAISLTHATESTPLMEWLPRLRVYRHNLDEYFYNERMRGEVCHRAMEHLRITGNNEKDAERALFLAKQDFQALGALPTEELHSLDNDLRGMLHWVLNDQRVRSWIHHGTLEPEIMDENGECKRLDLFYVTNDECVIADFKTGKPSPENQKQVQNYMRIINAMGTFPQPAQGYLIYLDQKEIHTVQGETSCRI